MSIFRRVQTFAYVPQTGPSLSGRLIALKRDRKVHQQAGNHLVVASINDEINRLYSDAASTGAY